MRTRVDLARSSLRIGRTAITALLALAAAGCIPEARDAVPQQFIGQAEPIGETDIRFWGDTLPSDVDQMAKVKYEQVKASRPDLVKPGARPTLNFLAISGGGSDGAFGAGLLAGWTASGTRPEFEIVTGVSTGALTAPFAFLGPAYDGRLKEIYTQYATKDLLRPHPLAGLVGGDDSLASAAPLQKVLAGYVDERLLAEVAREYNRGRRLLIGTTNIDAQRPVVWDMGKIAARGGPEALQLFRDVLLASASIPGVFPPMKISVAAAGATYDELHVDGGTTTQVFLMPPQFTAHTFDAKLNVKPKRKLYIIRNGRIDPEYKVVKASTIDIASRSISTLIKTQGIGDLYQLYELAEKNHMDFNLAYIPGDFPDTSKEAFDTTYMKSLYALGYDLGKAGYDWKKSPVR